MSARMARQPCKAAAGPRPAAASHLGAQSGFKLLLTHAKCAISSTPTHVLTLLATLHVLTLSLRAASLRLASLVLCSAGLAAPLQRLPQQHVEQQQHAPWQQRRLAAASRRPARAVTAAAAAEAVGTRGPVVVVDNYDSFTYNLCQVGQSSTRMRRGGRHRWMPPLRQQLLLPRRMPTCDGLPAISQSSRPHGGTPCCRSTLETWVASTLSSPTTLRLWTKSEP